jgi:uncharacterized protein (TIGR02678 family)
VSSETDTAERRRAVRSLIAQPVLDGRSGNDLTLVRRHRAELQVFFSEQLGYQLDATRPRLARVNKNVGPGHIPRGLKTRSGRAFDKRRYAITCLVLASLESAGDHTTAGRLFEEVATRAVAVAGLGFRTDVAADRRTFIQAVQAVVDLGVLELAEGDEEAFARNQQGGDALYRVDRDRLGLLPAVTRPPSLARDPDSMLAEPYPDTDDGRLRRRRHRVMRALVEQPVVYIDDLAPDEVDYLVNQRASIERTLAVWTGLELEVRAEGWVAVDPDGDLTDSRWPDYGTAATSALRMCDELRSRRARGDRDAWPRGDIVAFVAALAADYKGSWRKGADADGATDLATEAIAILVAFRLAQLTSEGGLVARPAAGRFAATTQHATTTAEEFAL